MTTLGFTGDIALSRYMTDTWQKEDLLSPEILQYLNETDCTIPNVECALFRGKAVGTGTFHHASDPDCVSLLKKINGKVWNIANNHILDCGTEGLAATVALAAENQCKTLGTGMTLSEAARVAYFENVGVFSVNYCPRYITAGDEPGSVGHEDWAQIKANIDEIRETCRWCVIIAHSGSEFTSLPLPAHRDRFRRYLELGADVVVAHHPHVVQNYELFGGQKAIFYSLGNFIFDTDYQRRQKFTDNGILLRLHFAGDSFTFDHLPIHIDRKQHRVVVGQTPAIFQNIPGEVHELLWPLAAMAFHRNQYAAHTLTAKTPLETNEDWLKWEEHKKEVDAAWRDVAPGEGLMSRGAWKRAPKELIDYLLNSICDPA